MKATSFIGNTDFENQKPFLVFRLDAQGYALYLSVVEKVVRAAEITYLPKVPEAVLGVINWEGKVLPVVNIRSRFRLPEKEIALTDRFIFARTAKRRLALPVDFVDGVILRPREEVLLSDMVVPGLEYVEGIVRLDDSLVLIHDLDRFFSPDEETVLDSALKTGCTE